MEECELCGRQINEAYVVSLENTDLRVCASCSKGKKVIKVEGSSTKKGDMAYIKKSTRGGKESEAFVDNLGDVIRNARNSMQLPLKVLAEMINEKEGYLLRIESGRALPSDDLAKKLEKALHIKLTTKKEDEPKLHTGKKKDATLGDFILR